MTTLTIHFSAKPSSERTPHIRDEESVEFACDLASKEGSITFDGYYYVEDHAPPYPEDETLQPWMRPTRHREWLPKVLDLYMQRRESEPYKDEFCEGGGTVYYHKVLEEAMYTVEVYKRVVHECTDQLSEDIDERSGGSMQICFFPTNRQTLYFRVLEAVEIPKEGLKDYTRQVGGVWKIEGADGVVRTIFGGNGSNDGTGGSDSSNGSTEGTGNNNDSGSNDEDH